MAGKRSVPLRNITDVSRFLAKLINQLNRGEIEESKAGKLGYLCNILKSSLEAGDLEERLEALEKQVRKQTEPEPMRRI